MKNANHIHVKDCQHCTVQSEHWCPYLDILELFQKIIFHYFPTSQLSSALVAKQEAVISHNCAAGPEIGCEAQSVFLEQMVRI